MGHPLERILYEIEAKYSADVHDAYESALAEGYGDAIFLIKEFRDLFSADPVAVDWLNQAIGFLEQRR